MKKFTARTTGAVGAIAVSMAMFGTGVASADQFAGQTYADASANLAKMGGTAVIAGRIGNQLPDDECLVTRSQRASWQKGDRFNRVYDTVLLFLNCNAPVASATKPGNSLASPEGRAAKQVQDTADYINAHPEYCGENAVNTEFCKNFCTSHSSLCTG
jgi:hypothetical protein